nr:chromosome segregation protein SMC [Maliibacterium massiliense]
MQLKKLELHGFKSFAERTQITFDAGITAIVGPNGSGKSNVSDAVRWVLGEQSARQLRGGKMEDIIFAGTQKRKPQAFAEVSLLLDNSDGGLPVEYSEVQITRRMYRSGESEYFINRNSCRLRDIVDLFRDTGAGKEGYSIVGQGRVDEILSNRAEERRAVFEEASGVAKYKARKDEARRKLDQTEANLTRIEDIILELEEQVAPLEEQSRLAQQYLSLRDELRAQEINYFLVQFEKDQARIGELGEQMAQMEQAHAEAIAEDASLRDALKQVQQQGEEAEQAALALRDALAALAAAQEKHAGENKLLSERIARAKEEVARLDADIAREQARLAEIDAQMAALGDAAQSAEALQAQQAAYLQNLEQEQAEIDAALAQKERALEAAKQAVMDAMNRASDVKARKSQLETMLANVENRLQELAGAMQRAQAQVDAATQDGAQAQQDYDAAQAQRDALAEKRTALLSSAQTLAQQRGDISKQVQQLAGEVNQLESRLRMLREMKRDYEGYQSSVRNLLRDVRKTPALSGAVLGVVAELISVPAQLEKAVEVALGAAQQNVVTASEQEAKALISHLRAHQYGRATFLPLSSVRPRLLSAAERDTLCMKGCLGVASDLVRYDAKYRPAVENLLGRVVLVEDMDAGIALARRNHYAFRIVTLAGDVLNAGGSMTGGSMQSKYTSLFARDRELARTQEQLQKSTAARDEAIAHNQQMKERIAALGAQASALEGDMHEAELHLARARERQDILRQNLEERAGHLARRVQEEAQLRESLADIRQELAALSHVRQDAPQTQVDADLSALQLEVTQARQRALAMQQTIADVRVQLASADKEHAGQLAQQRLYAQEQQRIGAHIAQMQARLDEAAQGIAKDELQLGQSGAAVEAITQQTAQQRAALQAAQGTREQLAARARQAQQALDDLAARSGSILEQHHRMEMQKARAEADMENLQTRMWDAYELTYATAQRQRSEDFVFNGAQARIAQLRSRMKGLGTVNVSAIEEYQRVTQRRDFLTAQRDDLVRARDDLQQAICELQQKMEKRFAEQFALINAYFKEIFVKLFGGGTAELILLDPEHVMECGIDIVAQPPGKKLQTLSLLSGGERTMTAIAILFAMLSLKPTPFCILDEIEANLDEANVSMYAEFLREYTQKTQFVIITHRKGSMEAADMLYGIAMEEKGISRLVSVRLSEKAAV